MQNIKELMIRAKAVYKKRGMFYIIRASTNMIFDKLPLCRQVINSIWLKYYQTFKSRLKFTFQKQEYHYFYHRYSTTWESERAVEIPIIWRIVRKNQGMRILEVGNVLPHYFAVKHDVLDKFEKAENVINKDVVDFLPEKKYELIVSISTLEHVGFDEQGNRIGKPDSLKIIHAINNLKNILSKNGRLVITFPWGYNPKLDKLVKDGKIKFTGIYCMKRISKDNRWAETGLKEVIHTKFGEPFAYANGIVFGVIER